MQKAFQAMAALEEGAVANPMSKEWWPLLAGILTWLLTNSNRRSRARFGKWNRLPGRPHWNDQGRKWSVQNLLVIGIGGSAWAPTIRGSCLGHPQTDRMRVFFDNTDPDGMQKVLSQFDAELGQTLCSHFKSGGTKRRETERWKPRQLTSKTA